MPARGSRRAVIWVSFALLTVLIIGGLFQAPATIVVHAQLPTPIVISQVYGGGGNSGAVWKNDFIELYNASDAPVPVNSWSVQYNSAAGTGTWQLTTLVGTIAPRGYYLVQQAAGAGGTLFLPTPDRFVMPGIMMSATMGKVALVTNSTALTGGNPMGLAIIDRVGYGPTASSFEGSGRAPGLQNELAGIRRLRGCIDSNDNAADFSSGVPRPRNSAAPVNTCIPTPLTISQIQGDGSSSPHDEQLVQTSGIVTARTSRSFFIQTPDGEGDLDPATSDGLLVFTFRTPPAEAAVGNHVTVTSFVQEFIHPEDPLSLPVTEIADLPLVDPVSEGNPVPAAKTLTAGDTDPAGSLEQLEPFEGMRVLVERLTVIAPTMGNVNGQTALATSNGIFSGIVTGLTRPFREPGIERPEPVPMPPCCIPEFDANPERLRVDSQSQPGSMSIDVSTGDVVKNVVGPLDYVQRTYTIVMDPPTPGSGVRPANLRDQAPRPDAEEWTVASFNLNQFFGPPLVPEAAFARRLTKASLAIRTRLNSPDIIGVQEVDSLTTLGRLAQQINEDTGGGDPDPAYQAFLIDSPGAGNIEVGFLVKRSRVTVVDEQVVQEAADERFEDGTLLHDRPPLVLKALIHPAIGDPFPVTVYVNHLRSRVELTDPSGRVRRKRRAQAESLARLIQARQNAFEHVVSVGDYNSFEFNDGYADVMGTLVGLPTPEHEVEYASPDLVAPDLWNLTLFVPGEQRYSYVFDGNAQVLDHVLSSESLQPYFTRATFVHINADFAEILRNDLSRAERLSDHDPPIAYFTLPR